MMPTASDPGPALVLSRVPVCSGHEVGVGEGNVAYYAQLLPEEARLQNNQRGSNTLK